MTRRERARQAIEQMQPSDGWCAVKYLADKARLLTHQMGRFLREFADEYGLQHRMVSYRGEYGRQTTACQWRRVK